MSELDPKTGTGDSELIGDLVIAMLTVNNWPLEKACEMRAALEREGVFDLARLSKFSHEGLFQRLRRAGYTKSDYVVGLLCDRLQAMAEELCGDGLTTLKRLLEAGPRTELNRMLLSVKGVGTAVLETFHELRRL